MNIPQSQVISSALAFQLIEQATSLQMTLVYSGEKHQLILEDNQDWLAKIYLPWTWELTPDLKMHPKEDSHFSLVLIKAGQAATGYFHLGQLVDHKIFRAYMVRQKQGKSQIKHLKTKGKSRAGSRIRLAETERFFDEINERLSHYSQQFPIDFWGISCAKTLWPYYFKAEVPPPFSSKSTNLIELPVHLSQASFEELRSIGELLQKFHLIVSDKGKHVLDQLTENPRMEKNEDW